MAKIELHIPVEQYGFVAVILEDASPEKTAEVYKEYADAFKAKPDNVLASREWNLALDSYINGNPMDSNTYYAMSPDQQKIIQELKKCFKRLEAKNK